MRAIDGRTGGSIVRRRSSTTISAGLTSLGATLIVVAFPFVVLCNFAAIGFAGALGVFKTCGAFLTGALFFAGAFFATTFFTAAFLAGAFFTGDFFAGAFFAGAFLTDFTGAFLDLAAFLDADFDADFDTAFFMAFATLPIACSSNFLNETFIRFD